MGNCKGLLQFNSNQINIPENVFLTLTFSLMCKCFRDTLQFLAATKTFKAKYMKIVSIFLVMLEDLGFMLDPLTP